MADITREEIQEIVDKSVSAAVKQIAEIFATHAKQNDKRFKQFDERFEQFDKRFKQIDKRFDAIDHRFDRLEGRLEQLDTEMREGFVRVNTTLDGIAARLETDHTERVALSAQVTRHEDWIEAAAPTVGVSYTPGA